MIRFARFLIGIFILSSFIALFSSVYSQETRLIRDYDVSTLSSEFSMKFKGLSQNSVQCMTQDSKGYMWFGTFNGLNRFDGLNFVVYTTSISGESNSISNSNIICLYPDSDGFIWVGTANGLNKFDPFFRKFEHYRNDTTSTGSLTDNSITSIIEDESGNIWIGTEYGLNMIQKNTGIIKQYFYEYNVNGSLSNNRISSLFIDKQGVLWVGTWNGLNKYNVLSDSFESYYGGAGQVLPNSFINCICEDSSGNLWLGTGNGIGVMDSSRNNCVNYYHDINDESSLSSNIIVTLLADSRGNIWIGTYGDGLNLYNRESDSFINYVNSTESIWGSNNNYILSLYEDKSGIIWVGSQYKGVKKIDPNTSKFRHHLANNVVWSIYEFEPEIFWVGTDLGVFEYRRIGRGLSYINNRSNNSSLDIRNRVTSIFKCSRGYYWFGTPGGMIKYDHNSNTDPILFSYDSLNENCISDNRVYQIIEDSKGLFWISTGNGLSTYQPDNNTFINYFHDPDDSTSISDNNIYSVYEDLQNRIWVSTSNGLNIFNRDQKTFQPAFSEYDIRNNLSSMNISSVIEDTTGILWICTLGGGLNSYNENTGEFKLYTIENGLSDNMIYSIHQDSEFNLWLSTVHGLSKFNPITEKFTNYNVDNGLQSMEFNPLSSYLSESGELFFGGINGFNSFYPSNIKTNQYESQLVLTSFKVFNELQPDNFSPGDTIRLKHFENSFSFEFSSLDYVNPYENDFEYMLEGFDENWNRTSTAQSEINYPKVTPGNYVLRARKTGKTNLPDNSEYLLNLVIIPPWWTSTLFIIIAIMLSLGLIWILVHSRFQMERRSHETEKLVIDSERKALLSQMNPHFIFNSLSSIQSYILRKDENAANRYLGDFSSLIRRIMENSSRDSISLFEELETLNLYLALEKMRFANGFTDIINIDKGIDQLYVKIPPMMIQPYLENAILHGLMPKENNRELKMSIIPFDEKRLLCTIEDNGIGRKKAMQIRSKIRTHQPSGMKNIEERIYLHNKLHKTKLDFNITDLYDKSGEPAGTKVELHIPYVFD